MDKKILFFDVETTGRNWTRNDIVQLGAIIEINGQVEAELNLKCQPLDWDSIEPEALEVTGLTLDELKTFPPAKEAYAQFIETLGKFVDKFDRADKFYPAGYNVEFDLNFLSSFFKKQNDPYLGSWINWKKLDPLQILFMLDSTGKIALPNYKLGTVADHFGIEIDAHDAFSDIRATREIFHRLLEDNF